MSDTQAFYPFANQPPTSNQNVFPYDIIINETFPGIIFDPTEPGGVYSVIREVDGCLWFVNNADWDANSLEWTQEDPTNAALPAYALELCANGTFNRYFGAATVIPGDPITWQLVFEIDANGSVISTPPTVTASGDPLQQIHVTWNAGSATQVVARTVNITDTSSSSTSVFDQLVVNGTTKWLIDKNGILQAGSIPFARISGFSPVFNNATFTGTTTFNGPIDATDGATVTGGLTADNETVTGTLTAGSIVLSGGGTLPNSPTTTSAGFVVPAIGSTVAVSIHTASFFPVGTTLIIQGPSSSGTTSFRCYVTVSSPTSLTVQNDSMISGAVGDTIASGATVSYSTAYELTSTAGTTLITTGGTATVPTKNIEVATPYPGITATGFIIPAVGTTINLQYTATVAYPPYSYLIVYNNQGSGQVLVTVNGFSTTSGGVITTPVTVQQIQLGGVGSAINAGSSIWSGSLTPAILPFNGQTYATAQNFAIGASSGSLSLSALPGASSHTYLVICMGSLQLQNASRQLTLTGSGTGVSWPSSPQIYQNANAGTFPFFLYGTAIGGSAPSVAWSANDVLYQEPMTMVLTAYFQS